VNPSIPLFQRETLEFLPVVVTVDGDPVTDGVEIAVTDTTSRPEDWEPAATLGDAIGVMVDGATLGVGTFRVFARVTDAPEVPVVDAGTFRVI
jgi:hypothetical protein